MKQTTIEVLVYLYEYHLNAQHKVTPNHNDLCSELKEAGFNGDIINRACHWLDGLATLQKAMAKQQQQPLSATRHFNEEERKKLNVDVRGMLVYLQSVGILDPVSRELIIDRAMALESKNVTLEEIKWVTLLVLAKQPDKVAAIAWLEEFMFQNQEQAPIH